MKACQMCFLPPWELISDFSLISFFFDGFFASRVRRSRDVLHRSRGRRHKVPNGLVAVATKMRDEQYNKQAAKRTASCGNKSHDPEDMLQQATTIIKTRHDPEIKSCYWSFSRYPIQNPMFLHQSRGNARKALKMFNHLLRLSHVITKIPTKEQRRQILETAIELDTDSSAESFLDSSSDRSPETELEDEDYEMRKWRSLYIHPTTGNLPIS
ncbi:hypothetical protein Ciccas_004535 [Cichlidogyrus casuarinus]|uniref:Uncharacterized protein n=1 Tax=Cichlidogyrus casuarinus TaxID=1844966 RepID=A0ABD2QEQ3_9PLAT